MSLRPLIASVLTALVGWFGMLPPGAAQALPVEVPTVHAYNGEVIPATDRDSHAEREPPSWGRADTNYDAVDHRSRGASARPGTSTTYAYTADVQLVQVDTGSASIQRPAALRLGNWRPISGAMVATNGADNIANGGRLRAQLTGQEISGGHAFQACDRKG